MMKVMVMRIMKKICLVFLASKKNTTTKMKMKKWRMTIMTKNKTRKENKSLLTLEKMKGACL